MLRQFSGAFFERNNTFWLLKQWNGTIIRRNNWCSIGLCFIFPWDSVAGFYLVTFLHKFFLKKVKKTFLDYNCYRDSSQDQKITTMITKILHNIINLIQCMVNRISELIVDSVKLIYLFCCLFEKMAIDWKLVNKKT
jgi:hypothetical protein